MSAADASAPSPRRPRAVRRAWQVFGVVVCIIAVLLAVAWLNRRAATRQVLVGWLERQGVPAEVEFERVELDGLVARIRLGDPDNPDAVIERVEVDYAVGAPWSKGGLGVTPSRIRLVRPVVRATFADGKLSFGSLDPVIERVTGRPPRPDARGPLVLVEQGRLRLDSDYGPAVVLADARIDDGKLMRLSARMPAQSLKSGEVEARDLAAWVELTTTGDRVAVRGAAQAVRGATPGLASQAPRLTFTGDLPYPDLKTRRGDGRARVSATLAADRLAMGATEARDADARLTFDGQTSGWIDAFRLSGRTQTTVSAARLDGPGGSARGLEVVSSNASTVLERTSRGLGWSVDGPVRLTAVRAAGAGLDGQTVRVTSTRLVLGGRGEAFEAQGPVTLAAGAVAWDQLQLTGVSGRAELDLVADGGLRVEANGGLRAARGAWPLFGPPAGDDLPELAEMKRALSAFALDAPQVSVVAGDSGTRVLLGRPVTVRPVNGGVLTVRPAATPVFSAGRGERGGGALSLTATRGRGLPEAAFAVSAWRLTPSGFTATLDGRAALDFGLARGVALTTKGELANSEGRLTYTAAACTPFTVERLELDESDATDLYGALCPNGQPLVSVRNGAWRAQGTLTGVAAKTPFLALDVQDGEGPMTATGGPAGLTLELDVTRAGVIDATTPRRFNPLTARGQVRLGDENWSGGFDLAREGATLGRLTLAHDGRSGLGGLTIDAPSLVFAENGLQPDDLSPLAGQVVGSPAVGSVGFQGRVDWVPDAEGSSGGVLTIPGLDFVSAAGPVKGLKGTVEFTSLAPLVTATDQRLSADSLASLAPVTGIELVFDLDKSALAIDGGRVAVGGGFVSVEPFALPLDRTLPFSGVLVLDRVQLGDVIAGAGFGDKVKLDAVVSGRLPFTSDPRSGVRITGGTLSAVQPGRLSIAREALSGLEAGGGEAVPPNTVQDLAYQAMENLAFEVLSADVNSLDAGRLGVLFHIVGRHDPPQRQELRLSVADLISREFLNRELPLPSGTGIDLTLDTTLNANQLIGDLMALNRARQGQPEQTPAPPPPSTP